MSFTLIDDLEHESQLCQALGSGWVALDCEAAGFHRYSDRLCLLQVTTPKATYIVDPLAFDPATAFRGPLGDPAVEIVMHGADYDLRLLDRDLDVHVRGLFDTQVAAALLGESSLGLAALLEKYVGVKLSKKYQRADWARRPLPDEMLQYAASDTQHLRELADRLKGRLEEAGRTEWAREECLLLEATHWEEPEEEEDPVQRVRGARDLSPREVTALREALAWRDQIARERDKAPFRVAGDPTLVEAVVRKPQNSDELADVRGFNAGLAHQEGRELLERFERVAALPDAELVAYPRRTRTGPGRPPPEAEVKADRLKRVRNRRADDLGIDRGTMLPNAVLLEIVLQEPRSLDAMAEVPGLRRWQAAVLGEELLTTLHGGAKAR